MHKKWIDMSVFLIVCPCSHTAMIIVASSSICHGLPQCLPPFSWIVLMLFCFLAHYECFWILQQEWNKSQVLPLLPNSYGIILTWWSDTHLKNSSFPSSFLKWVEFSICKQLKFSFLWKKSECLPQSKQYDSILYFWVISYTLPSVSF